MLWLLWLEEPPAADDDEEEVVADARAVLDGAGCGRARGERAVKALWWPEAAVARARAAFFAAAAARFCAPSNLALRAHAVCAHLSRSFRHSSETKPLSVCGMDALYLRSPAPLSCDTISIRSDGCAAGEVTSMFGCSTRAVLGCSVVLGQY